MGDPAGEHALVCKLVGIRLAAWFGLPVDGIVTSRQSANTVQLPQTTNSNHSLNRSNSLFQSKCAIQSVELVKDVPSEHPKQTVREPAI
jgi:hypothetical protein